MNGENIADCIGDLMTPSQRRRAVQQLHEARDSLPHLGSVLCSSPKAIASVMEDIASTVYPKLPSSTVSQEECDYVCKAINLMRTIAAIPTATQFCLQAELPVFVYPLLQAPNRLLFTESMRLAALNLIAALVQVGGKDVIHFLTSHHFLFTYIRVMDVGTEMSAAAASFILKHILRDEDGLKHVCASPEATQQLVACLGRTVDTMADQPSPRLMASLLRCYLSLAEDSRGRQHLKQHLPVHILRTQGTVDMLQNDEREIQNLQQLLSVAD